MYGNYSIKRKKEICNQSSIFEWLIKLYILIFGMAVFLDFKNLQISQMVRLHNYPVKSFFFPDFKNLSVGRVCCFNPAFQYKLIHPYCEML